MLTATMFSLYRAGEELNVEISARSSTSTSSYLFSYALLSILKQA